MEPPVTLVQNLAAAAGTDVAIQGWLCGRRSGGKVAFLLVRDGTGTCQCVVEAVQPELFAAARELGLESSLVLSGRVRSDPRAPGGAELAVTGLRVLQSAGAYPIARKAHGVDFLLQHRHLWLRAPRQAALLRVRHTLVRAARQFFDDRGFTLVDTPILTPGAAEGAGTLFPVDYFGERVFLAQTGQLYLESACMALRNVYCFGPTFRAEKSKTRRHLTEFWMIEPEMAFAELPELIACAEEFVTALVGAVIARHEPELRLLERDPAPLRAVRPPFPRLTYAEAIELLHSTELRREQEARLEEDRARLRQWSADLPALAARREQARAGWQQDQLDRQVQELREKMRELETDLEHRAAHLEDARAFTWGRDLGGDEETLISRHFDRPVIITEYPRRVKAFYMKTALHNPEVVLNMDVLAPEGYGEIIGGSQREDRLEALQQRLAEEGLRTEDYAWYLDLRRYGSVPHGGFGLGIERTVAWICGLRHIRETIPFPRLMGRIYP